MPDTGALPLRARVVSDLAGIRALEPAWRALSEKSRDACTFTGYDWAHAAAEAFGGSRSLCVVTVVRGEEVVAILPLAVEKGVLVFIGMPEADVNDLICLPGLEAEAATVALGAILGGAVPWSRCTLDYLWEGSALLHALDALPARFSRRLHLMYRGFAPRAILDDPEAASKIVKKKNEQKLERQLGRKGNLVFRFLEERDEVRAGMEHLVRMHVARREEVGDSSVFLRPEIRSFYASLLPRLDPRSELRFFVAELDGRVLACQLAFESRGRIFCFKTGYDAEFRDYSPGTVMIRRLAQDAVDRGVRIFDHSRGHEAYKARFSNGTKRYYTIHVFRRGLAGWADRSVVRLKERAKANPFLYRLLRRFKLVAPAPAAPKAEGPPPGDGPASAPG